MIKIVKYEHEELFIINTINNNSRRMYSLPLITVSLNHRQKWLIVSIITKLIWN